MPKMNPNNQLWLRDGKTNQKKHIEMTEEEKANIADCSGKKGNHPCKNPVFRCITCGNYGCSQEIVDKCTEQGFLNDKCLYCGSLGTRVPVMKEDLARYIAAWEEVVPVVPK